MKNFASRYIFIFILLITFFISTPFAAGDGMPAIRYGEWENPPEKVFSSMFESRQLASVELLNDSHECINLFLSVYSLDPKENLTIIVPLRTLPVNVSGVPLKEKHFREKYKINQAEKEVIRQDMDEALGNLGRQTKEYFEFAFGSLVWTLPGEYTHENIHRSDGDSLYGKDSEGFQGDTIEKPEPIQHYEFDGFCIDVFGMDSGYILSEYLEEKNLILPDSKSLEKYNDQYIAVIESKTKPPIRDTDFDLLQENVPNTLETLIDELKDNPERNSYEITSLKYQLHSEIYDEIDPNLTYTEQREIIGYMDDLVDVVFGETDFEGEVLEIILPLDDNKIFFPLGTSDGWANDIGDIDILFKVPEDTSLSLPDSKDAFFDGSHWYLVQMENSNPDFDLESSLKSMNSDIKAQKLQATFIYDNYKFFGLLIIFAILILFWFGIASIQKKFFKKEGPVFKNPILWLLLGVSLIISIPGALLLLLIMKPLPFKKITKELVLSTLLILYPFSILLYIIGVII